MMARAVMKCKTEGRKFPQAPEERQNLAHRASRGLIDTPHTPALSPAGRGGTAERWVRALFPGLTAWAKIFRPSRGFAPAHDNGRGGDMLGD